MAVRHIEKVLVIRTTIDGKQCLRELDYHMMRSVMGIRGRTFKNRPFCKNYGALKLNSPRHKKCLLAELPEEAQDAL